jgi:hypothetical protein
MTNLFTRNKTAELRGLGNFLVRLNVSGKTNKNIAEIVEERAQFCILYC